MATGIIVDDINGSGGDGGNGGGDGGNGGVGQDPGITISDPETIDIIPGGSGSGSGSGTDIPKGCENCALDEECAVVYTTTDNPSIKIDGNGIAHWGPRNPKPGDLRVVELKRSTSEYRCIKSCDPVDIPPPPPSGMYTDTTSRFVRWALQCATCIDGEWYIHDPVPCVIPARNTGKGRSIVWPAGTSSRTHEWDTSYMSCPEAILVVDKISGGVEGLDGNPTPEIFGEPGMMFINPECPCNRKRNIPGTPTQSSIFDLIRSQAGTTSRPVTNEPTPQSSIFDLVRSQAAPVTTIASLSLEGTTPTGGSSYLIQQQQSVPILMMAQNVGTQSDGGGRLKCYVAPVSYTSDVTYNTGYENLDEVVDNTTSYVKGYIDYTLSTDTITVIEPKL